MRRTLLSLPLAAALAVAFAVAAPASAQIQANRATVAPAGVKLIDVKAAVTDSKSNQRRLYDIQPAEHVPLRIGDQVHVQIVGTAMIDGKAREVVVPVRFENGPGDWRIDTADQGTHGLRVVARQPDTSNHGREGALTQILYTIDGDYDVRTQLANGRITFEIDEQTVTAPQPQVAPETRDRWRRAERIADRLHAIRFASGKADAALVERIYLSGANEVRQIASTFAQDAVRGRQVENRAPWDVTRHLYVELLGRKGSADDLWKSDAGFRGNVRLLMESGYPALVSAIVGSQEFAKNQELDTFARLALPRTDDELIRLRREMNDIDRTGRSTRP